MFDYRRNITITARVVYSLCIVDRIRTLVDPLLSLRGTSSGTSRRGGGGGGGGGSGSGRWDTRPKRDDFLVFIFLFVYRPPPGAPPRRPIGRITTSSECTIPGGGCSGGGCG